MDRPARELVRLAWPIAVSMLSYSVMTLVDTLFVGRIGPSALAGVGLGGVAAFTVICFGLGLLRGLKVLVSQAVGAGQADRASGWLSAGAVVAGATAVLLMAIGGLVVLGIGHLAETAATAANAETYLLIRVLGTPVVLGYATLREHSYALGDSRAPMAATVVANVVNIALDVLFILALEWGVAGAAWSTVIGQVVELGLLAWLGRSRLRFTRVTLADVRELLSVGLPTGVQFWLEVGSFAVLTVIISWIGEVNLAAHQVALQVIHFAFLPTAALAEAGAVMAGQAVGAGRMRSVRRVAHIALSGALVYMLLCTLILVFGATGIAGAFTDDARLIEVTVGLLHIAAVFQLADGAAIVGRGVLRGTGDVRFPAAVGIVSAWVFTPPLAWWLGVELGMGASGGWVGLTAEIVVAAGFYWWRIERSGWLVRARVMRARAAAPLPA